MTAAEIIALAYTRNIATGHITQADIDVATREYVTKYITPTSATSTFYTSYVHPVIAFGVACDIFNRISSEITDRGVVEMLSDGARVMDAEGKRRTLGEYEATRDKLIEIMVEEAEDEGLTLVYEDDVEHCPVGFTGLEKDERL